MSNKFYIFVLFAMLMSCRKDTPITEVSGREYAGLQVGRELVYKVEYLKYFLTDDCFKVYYDTTLGKDTVVYDYSKADTFYALDANKNSLACFQFVFYFIKEKIADKIIDGEGDSAYVIHRFYSSTATDFNALPDSIWTAKFKNNHYVRIENNTPYIKMSYPVSYSTVWNMNGYNSMDNDETQYRKIKFTFVSDTLNFTDVVEVEQEDKSSDFSIQQKTEYYANGVGLIYKKYIELANCQNICCPPDTSCSTQICCSFNIDTVFVPIGEVLENGNSSSNSELIQTLIYYK